MTLELALDCKHYLGDRPCAHRRRCTCEQYEPMGTRIVIIKLAALGDVVRTASLLPTLRREYPASHVTWVSKPSGVRILAGHPQVDQLLPFDAETILTLSQQRFDLVLSLDKEPGPTALCNALQCDDKRGIGMSPFGTARPCQSRTEDYFELGLDDDLKFHGNRKSYPRLIHDALGLPYIREPYRLYPSRKDLDRAEAIFAPWRAEGSSMLIGLNTGSGSVFANKAPSPERWAEVARRLRKVGHGVVLLGGPEEEQINRWIAQRVDGAFLAGSDNTERQFTAIVGQCDAVVTGDTLALHVAVSQRTPVVALFGPTCEQEIDLFDRGVKIVSPVSCGPCYRRSCDRRPNCMDAITPEDIVSAVLSVASARRSERVAL